MKTNFREYATHFPTIPGTHPPVLMEPRPSLPWVLISSLEWRLSSTWSQLSLSLASRWWNHNRPHLSGGREENCRGREYQSQNFKWDILFNTWDAFWPWHDIAQVLWVAFFYPHPWCPPWWPCFFQLLKATKVLMYWQSTLQAYWLQCVSWNLHYHTIGGY